VSETLTAWRIAKRKHAANAFDGEGARQFPGRWNNRGTPMIYTASTPSLAMLELLVHLEAEDILTTTYCRISVEFPVADCVDIGGQLPKDWKLDPPPASTRVVGDAWIVNATSLVLAVPSVISPVEQNYLINPRHPDFQKISIGKPEALKYDPRFAK
jgi:RES domain-containing protein